MKKVLGVVLLLALASMFVLPAFAAETDNSSNAWFDQMFSTKKAWVDQAVKDGQLTQKQGEAYKQQFDQMYQFHSENGFVCPMGGPGGGFGRGMGNGMGYGFGAQNNNSL